MDKENVLKTMRAERFKRNNGKVLLTVNILRHDYVTLPIVLSALEKSERMTDGEFIDSIHFLHGNSYIDLRRIDSKKRITNFAGENYKQLEAILTQERGVRLLTYDIEDEAVVLEW